MVSTYRLIAGMSILLYVVLYLTLTASFSLAGNKEMVEKNVRELDRINKEAVGGLPDLPKDGTVEIEAEIRYRKGEPDINILRHKIREINRPYAGNGTSTQASPETRNETGLIKEGTNYEVKN